MIGRLVAWWHEAAPCWIVGHEWAPRTFRFYFWRSPVTIEECRRCRRWDLGQGEGGRRRA